jgi:tripartite-type tricarboxylate transporter receptor subunit TctC
MMRFFAHAALAAAVLINVGAPARAQQPYPTRPITVVVPFAAGGPTDVMTRILGHHMSQTLGQQIVVENVTGGGGSIGAARVAKAAPDGYTMVMGNLGTHAAAVGLYKNLSYDPRVDFEPVMLVASTPMVLVVRKTLALDTLKDFTAYAVANPHKLTFGSAGTGSISHLTYLLYTHLTKTEIEHVPYRGLSQSVNDLLSGQIDLMFDQVVSATPHILSGGVKPIAVTATKRAAAIPNVPSSTEAGLPELQTTAWTALFFPKGTPQPMVERVNAALDKAMRDEAVAKRLAELGADLPADAERAPQALGKLVRSEIDKWVPLIQSAGVVVN